MFYFLVLFLVFSRSEGYFSFYVKISDVQHQECGNPVLLFFMAGSVDSMCSCRLWCIHRGFAFRHHQPDSWHFFTHLHPPVLDRIFLEWRRPTNDLEYMTNNQQ